MDPLDSQLLVLLHTYKHLARGEVPHGVNGHALEDCLVLVLTPIVSLMCSKTLPQSENKEKL